MRDGLSPRSGTDRRSEDIAELRRISALRHTLDPLSREYAQALRHEEDLIARIRGWVSSESLSHRPSLPR